MYQYVLMGAAAAGAIGSLAGYQTQKRAIQMEKNQLRMRLQQETLASEQQGIMNLESLRSTLASQRAIFAARGQASGKGSALAISQKSIRSHGRDEEARKLSLSFLKAQRLSQIETLNVAKAGAKQKMGFSMLQSGLSIANTYSMNKQGYTVR